ncbi:MAG TPA: HAMP domain-containing sensor histidine kinase [Candidatus Acidoferrales bacterium]|nr:HAMP domain-containing sensor histidine kinase [Candidatus Acidoferrales bacterium]
MADFQNIVPLIPLPVVDLHGISVPRDGLLLGAPPDCPKNWASGLRCHEHYHGLANADVADDIVQCPFGYASRVVRHKNILIALTGFIPYPRLGGDRERRAAKKRAIAKLATEQINKAVVAVKNAVDFSDRIQVDTVRRQSVALHEIRKLNRTVKQTAERLCREDSPGEPDAAEARFVQIWKSAELMSQQFDVIELLANEDLAKLPRNSVSEVYRIFDKCVRIYRHAGHPNRFSITAQQGYSGKILACDKTLSIIPSALIENALKYSVADTLIHIDVESKGGNCVVTVTNQAKAGDNVTRKAFQKGVRLSSDQDGTGHGLHLVKIVVEQHGGTIDVLTRPLRKGVDEIRFIVRLPELHDARAQKRALSA